MTLETIASVFASGLVLGSLYGLMAAGLSLVWSTLGIFNFAHGVFMTLGAYVAWQKVMEFDPKTPGGEERLKDLRRHALGEEA